MQGEIFSEKNRTQKQSLVISTKDKKTLSKNQLAFNKLTERIERLQKEIAKKHRLFDAAINLYSEKYHPAQRELIQQKRQALGILWNHYKSKKLSATDQRHLKELLKEYLQDFISLTHEKPDDELKKIFKELEGESFEKFEKRTSALQKMMMQEMFDQMDVDIDLNEVDANDTESLQQKLAEAKEKLQEREEKQAAQREKRKQKKNKTKAGLAKETEAIKTNELKQKNISTIYKQLAKLFHPDLEQDEIKKAEKEILMKELTVAYESKDLHALLTLELKWINKEHDHLENLSDEKLAVYLQILREQASSLELEKNQMAIQPRYSVLINEFGPAVQHQPLREIEEMYWQLKQELVSVSEMIANLSSSIAHRHIKNIIKVWRQVQRESEMDNDFFEFPF
jgi:hypothetical protein